MKLYSRIGSHTSILFFLLLKFITTSTLELQIKELSDYLSMGDKALQSNEVSEAVTHYEEGIAQIEMDMLAQDDEDSTLTTKMTSSQYIAEAISIYTNLGTAYSILAESSPPKQVLYKPKSIHSYEMALQLHSRYLEYQAEQSKKQSASKKTYSRYSSYSTSKTKLEKQVTKLAAQASFFLGMEYQDVDQYESAMTSYALAYHLDPYYWSAVANMAALIMDYHDYDHSKDNESGNGDNDAATSPMMKLYENPSNRMEEALLAYNKAYEILTSRTHEPTDYPENPNYMLSQIQNRIGMILNGASSNSRSCSISESAEKVDCRQMAIHAFSEAVNHDGTNEAAKHMLAAMTADATVTRASNPFVTELFEKYAKSFEHSLVDELGYNGYERLRRGFDRAFGGQDNVPTFPLVVDAGCGTGLVGEQFRNVSDYLIGADLSPSILEEAQKRRPTLYDNTYVGDVTELFDSFTSKGEKLSLIVAADSYIYFGDLIPLFESMAKGLHQDESDESKNGIVAFTLENVDHENEKSLSETTPNWRWQLTPSGRFAHRKEYVEHVAKMYNLKTVHYEPMDGFRYERGTPVRGHLFVMQMTNPTDIKTEL